MFGYIHMFIMNWKHNTLKLSAHVTASLGQCVSALSKTSSVPESYNNTLNSFTLSDKDPDLWHKDLHPPSDTPKPKVQIFISCTGGYLKE